MRIEGGNMWVADAAYDSIGDRNSTVMYRHGLVGYAHPYYFD